MNQVQEISTRTAAWFFCFEKYATLLTIFHWVITANADKWSCAKNSNKLNL